MKKNKSKFDQKLKRTKKLHKAIKINLKRRTIIVDDEMAFFKDIPIPSWIELSIIDVCNRVCSFCPKADDQLAPNTFQKMNLKLKRSGNNEYNNTK